MNQPTRILLLTVLTAPLLSCGGGGDGGKPAIDADAAASQALELFDKNSDGALDPEELKLSPGLAEGKTRADSNGDGRITAEEISARIESWNESPERLVCPELEFILDRRYVAQAKVIFEPEPFLTDWLEAKQTSTNELGRCSPQISRQLPGMNMGFYRVKLSKERAGKERIPAIYNEQTQIGVEFCTDRPRDENLLIQIQLGKGKRRR